MFQVAINGQSVQTAAGPQSLLNDNNPLAKLDTTNQVSFQTINVLFNSEPPQAPSSAPFYSNTLITSFNHPYTYTPSIWMMWQNPSATFPPDPTSPSASATTFYAFGDDGAGATAKQTIGGSIVGGTASNLMALLRYDASGTVISPTDALFYATADATKVYLYLMKRTLATVGGNIRPLFIIGESLNVRLYTFVEPVSG